MKMLRWQVRVQRILVGTRQADMKDLGLRMVEPNDRMEMARHVYYPS
jgi:hypothetical protein